MDVEFCMFDLGSNTCHDTSYILLGYLSRVVFTLDDAFLIIAKCFAYISISP